jgi:hypothetical protein
MTKGSRPGMPGSDRLGRIVSPSPRGAPRIVIPSPRGTPQGVIPSPRKRGRGISPYRCTGDSSPSARNDKGKSARNDKWKRTRDDQHGSRLGMTKSARHVKRSLPLRDDARGGVGATRKRWFAMTGDMRRQSPSGRASCAGRGASGWQLDYVVFRARCAGGVFRARGCSRSARATAPVGGRPTRMEGGKVVSTARFSRGAPALSCPARGRNLTEARCARAGVGAWKRNATFLFWC